MRSRRETGRKTISGSAVYERDCLYMKEQYVGTVLPEGTKWQVWGGIADEINADLDFWVRQSAVHIGGRLR